MDPILPGYVLKFPIVCINCKHKLNYTFSIGYRV